MKLPEWVRKLPHPEYGHYGGRKRRCESNKAKVCPIPIDGMDSLFQRHDEELRMARVVMESGGVVKAEELRKNADETLAAGLKAYKGPYKEKIYGPIYRHLAMIPFSKYF